MNTGGTARSHHNWWKVALFVVLLVSEGLRELYVLAVNEPKQLMGPSLMVYSDVGYVHAEGVWARSDGGSSIVQNTVVIDCFQKWNTCIEVNNTFIPEATALNSFVDYHDIDAFTDESIAYSNDEPQCADYRVRIDRSQQRVIATRVKREGVESDLCTNLEKRVAMELKSGIDVHSTENWSKEHFLPIVRILQAAT